MIDELETDEDLDAGDGDPDVAAADEELRPRPRPAAPLLRSKHYTPAPKSQKADGKPSPWERPREGFSEAMAQRSKEANATKAGHLVSSNRNVGR